MKNNQNPEVSNAILNKLAERYGINHKQKEENEEKDDMRCGCSSCSPERGLDLDDLIKNSPFFHPDKMRYAGMPMGRGNQINMEGDHRAHPERHGGVRVEPHAVEIEVDISELVDGIMEDVVEKYGDCFASTVDVPREAQDKIIERTIKLYEEEYGKIPNGLRMRLMTCYHELNVTCFEKYTVAEVVYRFEGYNHHFFGLAVRNPNEEDTPTGVSIAYRLALIELIKEISVRMEKAQAKAQRRIEAEQEKDMGKIQDAMMKRISSSYGMGIGDFMNEARAASDLIRGIVNLGSVDVKKHRRGD